MRNPRRKIAFVLAASDHGTMIVNRLDYRMVDQRRGFGVGFQILEGASFDATEVAQRMRAALDGQSSTRVEAETRHGASVFTTLTVERGRFVRVRSAHYTLTLLAVVRNTRTGADNIPRLHLEFVGRTWPLELIE